MSAPRPSENAEGSKKTAPDVSSLLNELHASQEAVSADVAIFVASMESLDKAVHAVETALSDAQKAKLAVLAEKQTALEAIQVKLDIAVASIRAVSHYPVAGDLEQPHRLGREQEYP